MKSQCQSLVRRSLGPAALALGLLALTGCGLAVPTSPVQLDPASRAVGAAGAQPSVDEQALMLPDNQFDDEGGDLLSDGTGGAAASADTTLTSSNPGSPSGHGKHHHKKKKKKH